MVCSPASESVAGWRKELKVNCDPCGDFVWTFDRQRCSRSGWLHLDCEKCVVLPWPVLLRLLLAVRMHAVRPVTIGPATPGPAMHTIR